MQMWSAVEGVSKIKVWIEGGQPSNAHLRMALFYAVLLHLVLAALMPSIPNLTLPASSRASILNVFLTPSAEKEKFEQSLNQPFPFPNADEPVLELTLGSASPETGAQATVSEASADQTAQQAENLGDTSARAKNDRSIQAILRTDLAYIRMFAKQEAARHSDENPEEIEQFRRSFNSRRNYHRRNQVEASQNRYGDYYARSNSSTGDVCFLQREGENRDEMSTNIVYFYRCGSAPMNIDLEAQG